MGVTNIQDAKLLIQASRQVDRANGLKDLVHILKHNRGKPTLEALGNKAYLALCDTLFQCLRDERSAFLRSKTKTAKSAVLLPLSASALRHVIATGVRTIKSSTVEIIIDTIIEVFPDTDGSLLKPLLEDLPKTLRSLFEYQPHVERLSKDCWDAAVDFCIDSLSSFFAPAEPEVEPHNSWSTSVSSRARTPFESTDVTSSRASPRAPVARTKSANDDKSHIAEDFVQCLSSLVKAANAPLLDKADAVIAGLLQYLRRRSGRSSGAVAALAAINSILTRIALQSLELTKQTVRELLPLMKPMWSEVALRDEIIITLVHTEAHISSLLDNPDDESVRFDLEALIETMYGEYRKRQDTTAHQYLEEDHLCFRHLGYANKDTHPLNTCAFSMETEQVRFEGLWGTVSTIARASHMLDQQRCTSSQEYSNMENAAKRVRVTQLFQEYLRHVLEPRSNAKRAALQVVAFMVQEGPVDKEDLQSMLEKLTSCIADENPAHAVWAMIGLAGAALQRTATHASLKSYWISAWQSASRAATSMSVSRAASHLMDVLLRLQIVPFSAVSDIVQSMLLSIELSGPAALTETSSSLMATIMRERMQENPTHFNTTSERVLSWLFSKWTPSTDPEDRRVSAIESCTATLCKSLAEVLTRPQVEQQKVDAVLETCTKSLPCISSIHQLKLDVFKQAGIHVLAQHLCKALGDRRSTRQSFHAEDDDFMDVDDTADSQTTAIVNGSETDVPRHDIQAQSDTYALRASCAAYLQLITSVAAESDLEHSRIPTKFVDFLVSLQESELLRSRPLLRALWDSDFAISRNDCFNLLERYSEALIDPRAREYNTSEVANGMLVEVLIGTVLVWGPDTIDRDAQDLYENVEALYAYYVKEMEKNGVRQSANLQKLVAVFLHHLLKHHPDLGQHRKVPSVRTSLFGLLARSEMTVKHHIAEQLPTMFEDFVLSEHDKILRDVDSSLPGDDEGIEGIAVRLLVLSKLASQWHTLLRQCIYLIFATAGSVQGAAMHAKTCIANVARARGLDNSQYLFRLFAPQVIFIWLDRGRILADIPFVSFGYNTLEELLRDITAEAVGQAMMCGRKTEVEYLADRLGMSVGDLLLANMGKAAAYTIAWDTCRGFARNRAEPSNSDLLKRLVGSDLYYSTIQKHSPQILGYIFQTIDHEERVPKALEKKPAFVAAAEIMAAMTDVSHSSQNLNIGIEPAFSAFYLPDQLERDDPATLWSPNSYTYVLRSILDRIHPALGSLYARSMIRKIRILVALAGPVAYEGYPLQMTLQSLRPFLIDVQCAEDAVGIMQHLFEHGTHYLRKHLAFLTGIGLSILISVRVFLGSTQESTTQQSQHVSTMTAANRFHKWLSEYLRAHAEAMSASERSSSVKAFRLITTAASQVTAEGNSLRGSEESKLLLEILDDVGSGRKLLNKTSREVALNLLCQNFQPASMARDDILGVDRDAAEYAPLVWDSCQRNGVGHGYLLWAAKVLGRAYSAEAIVREVIDLFYSDDRAEVSLAEDAVRRLISRIDKRDPVYVAEMAMAIPEAIAKALGLPIPDHSLEASLTGADSLEQSIARNTTESVPAWIRGFAMALCRTSIHDPILGALSNLLDGIDSMAERLLPFILHLVLLNEFEGERRVRKCVSAAMMLWFQRCDSPTTPYVRILIEAILYLRSQPVPKETTRVDRDRWLEIDFLTASQAANTCGMYRSALLFAETSSGQPIIKSSSRRSSVLVEAPKIPLDLQLSIYKNLDEPDSFYGVERGSTLLSVLDRLEYEGDGGKTLLFRGARLDSQMRRTNAFDPSDSRGTVKSLIMLNLNSVTHSLLSNDQFQDIGDDVVESTLHTARKLGQWDIKAPEANHTESSTLFKAFQGLHFAKSAVEAKENFERQLIATMNFLTSQGDSSVPEKARLRTLAALTEADEVIRAERSEHLLDTWDRMRAREKWMRAGEFRDVRQLLSCRETLFNVISANSALVDSLHARTGTIVKRVGLDIEATAQHEVANVLWEQGETDISIRMRQHLIEHADFDSQKVDLSLPVLLARLGHHLAEARLEKPDSIMKEYLEPAIRELKGQKHGSGPGQVFHEFAFFCDKQLQSPEAAEDMDRIKTVMDRKWQEYNEFTKLSKTDKSKGMRETYHRSARRAKTWYDLDHAEYERLRKGREQFLRQCLENYLLSLIASDEYNHDALRVFSLWLEYADTDLANAAVKSYLKDVPSGKFALLMNQLSSRLQAEETAFHNLLMELVFRICVEHPYHGMHQIFAIHMKVGAITREDTIRAKDESARSRQKAAGGLATALGQDKTARSYWSSIYQSNEIYHHLAMFKGEKESTQQGRELPLDRYKESKDLVSKVPKLNVPPATLQVEVRASKNYTDLPRIQRFKSTMSIANGLSAPKVITAIGTDGRPYKQLFKSGNDDLRQDAIMEQVFDQVSRLLRNHTATRIRNIGIRTYKVLPLSTRSGLMEFVQNTIPLHLWVMPAHEKYYPNDYKPDRCRKEIGAAQQDSLSTRTKVWQKVADNFHPVLRYFLLERFQDPDEWFERRLAYTRSTAAISILGHVLGLGDRHCHNILLDEKSGEVVHIDLGVSFEAGRVLPVPEVVPFRLTRDLVDAMGYTKTEGVFRRSCEFTMDTLREERESIMTLLNVLRYDPLVNWSVTPTKAKRMQEGNQDTNVQNGARASTVAPGGTPAPSGQAAMEDQVVHESNKKREKEEQAGEAGRALSVVEKKLSKTLSTKATVNELIQQATDERNLAVLYMGWASYA
ncbi:hypothetical protein SNOG_10359 [Parastagonospora nodorum SN15]|uniref:Serine/threonine-protein kinase Tel1 n=1 Tax=Phaeosphaeria nodorum (strain SN15 / ATCC MYA-4574 / FGSC 10173) TaxID=321614 RepID=Q0UD05_PHANO|nr:hypothetical protein SNOG_10359 [Parastagonospora nodorum SN15]EAT82694.2 hypothetical protein SNOG_10359 [Parastagonospora nodorum SN15]